MVLSYHDLRVKVVSTGALAARRIHDEIVVIRHRLRELDTDPLRLNDFLEDPVTHGLPTSAQQEIAHLAAVLSRPDYESLRDAYLTIDDFNRTKGGIRAWLDDLKTEEVRQAIERVEMVLVDQLRPA